MGYVLTVPGEDELLMQGDLHPLIFIYQWRISGDYLATYFPPLK